MFKAIEDNKIIAVNGTGEFPCMVYDYVEEETEHAVSDYVHVDGQFVLKTDDAAKEQVAAEVRAERDRRIDAVRWRIERYQTQRDAALETTETSAKYKKLLKYLQSLRDIPLQEGFPNSVEWPTEPK